MSKKATILTVNALIALIIALGSAGTWTYSFSKNKVVKIAKEVVKTETDIKFKKLRYLVQANMKSSEIEKAKIDYEKYEGKKWDE